MKFFLTLIVCFSASCVSIDVPKEVQLAGQWKTIIPKSSPDGTKIGKRKSYPDWNMAVSGSFTVSHL